MASTAENGNGHALSSDAIEAGREQSEVEPLLGRPGDAAQPTGTTLVTNLVLGTAVIAQFGVWILLALVWASVFLNKLILFSGHPLAQSLGVTILVQSMLLLQPTHTAEQKRAGQIFHASLNLAAFVSLLTGVVIIEYNKISGHNAHFHSVHGYLGVITSVMLLLQYFVGFTMWKVPALYGGEERAKSIWKYHRWSGYTVLLLLLATLYSATDTDYVKFVLKIKPWSIGLLAVLIIVGVFPRIQKGKLGFSA